MNFNNFQSVALSSSEANNTEAGWGRRRFRTPRLGTRTRSFSRGNRSFNETITVTELDGVYTMSFVGSMTGGRRGDRSWDFSRSFSVGA